MNISNQQWTLMHLLKCGVDDLSLLEDIKYDLGDLLDEMAEDEFLSLNNLLRLVFERAQDELSDAINERRKDALVSQEEIDAIKVLDPSQDVDYYVNCLDTHFYLDHYDLYLRYFGSVIDQIEYHTGFSVDAA